MKKKLIRITTVPISLEKLLENQLIFMSDYFDVTAISSDLKRLNKFGIDNNVRVKHINLTRKITPIKDLIALYSLYRYLKREKPYIVHSHTPKAGIVGMLASKLARVPYRLHTVAGLPLMEATGAKRKILNFVEKLTYKSATDVYPNSYGLEKIILKENFCKKEKLKVIANGSSNGINTEYFDPKLYSDKVKNELKSKLKINKKDYVFVFVGRLVKDKGINELIKAFKRLSNKDFKCKLLLVGPFENELDPLEKDTLIEIKTNKNIISVGYQKDVRPYYSISNALVFPSYREGLPNVVLQAGAMNLPSIVSNINGCNEIIEDNINGIIIPPKNIETLFVAMKKLLENKSFNEKLTAQTRKTIYEKYDQNFVWQSILDVYNKL